MTYKIFVYGSLKYGFHNNKLLKQSTKIAGCAITNDKFYMVSMGSFPAVFKPYVHKKTDNDYVTPNPVNIHGEVYDVNEEVLNSLDLLEGVPDFYNRELIKVSYMKGLSEIVNEDVYIYLLQSPSDYVNLRNINDIVLTSGCWTHSDSMYYK